MNNVYDTMRNHNKYLSKYACLDSDAVRFMDEKEDIRPPFFHDIDRIIYSMSYTRYIDKTQVFSFNENDHITKRMMHVQLVSKIARTIGRALSLNEDLIEAIALGHDLGHVPFGHVGERHLNDLSIKYNNKSFNHNVESVRNLMQIENHGKGWNLCVQVLDGILCHNGEFVIKEYKPIKKSNEEFLKQYLDTYDKDFNSKTLIPMTLEGCVVRISDIIAYLGRDIEDAIRLNIIRSNDIPSNITKVLGYTNKDIINNIVIDVLNNSINQEYLSMSDEVYNAVNELKSFNYKYIYDLAYSKEERINIEKMFNVVFMSILKDLNDNNKDSSVYEVFLKDMNEDYLKSTNNVEKTVDYIAGMTDDYFLKEYNKRKEK